MVSSRRKPLLGVLLIFEMYDLMFYKETFHPAPRAKMTPINFKKVISFADFWSKLSTEI